MDNKEAACILLILKNKLFCKDLANDEKYKIIVVERKSGKIGLPGGKVEENETTLDAAVRELFEETNIEVNKDKLKKVFACMVNGFYCTTYGVMSEDIDAHKILNNLRQKEVNIKPRIIGFNNKEFVLDSEFKEYNYAVLINKSHIFKELGHE